MKKTVLALAVSLPISIGLAYADTPSYNNPFIDNSSTQSTGTNTPSTAPSLQPAQPTYNFTQRSAPTGTAKPFIVSNTGPGAQGVPANPGSPTSTTLGPGGTQPNLGPSGTQPNLGPGGSQPAPIIGPGGLPASDLPLVQAVNQLDKDVKYTNLISLTSWNQTIQNQVQANAMLLPTSLNFLWNQTAYQNIQQLVPSSNNTSSQLQSLVPNFASSYIGSSSILSPQTYAQLMAKISSNPQSGSAQSAQPLGGGFMNMVSQTAQQGQGAQSDVLAAAAYAISNIAAMNQADSNDQVDSQMSILNAAVSAPLSTTPDPTTNQTWFQQLSTASSPQLLRSVAIMLALNNYMQYQNLKAQQVSQLLQAAQIVQEARLQQSIQTLDNNQAARQQTALDSLQFMLRNLQH
jgi:hypothetical protein